MIVMNNLLGINDGRNPIEGDSLQRRIDERDRQIAKQGLYTSQNYLKDQLKPFITPVVVVVAVIAGYFLLK